MRLAGLRRRTRLQQESCYRTFKNLAEAIEHIGKLERSDGTLWLRVGEFEDETDESEEENRVK